MSEPDREWHFIDQDGVVRPASDSELRKLLAGGGAKADTLVWRDGWEGWKTAREAPELAAAAAKKPKPAVGRLRVPLRPADPIGRRPMPTIDEDAQKPPAGSTLRPPGAVPPPPRAVPPADLGFLSASASAPEPGPVRIITPIDDLLAAPSPQGEPADTVPPEALVSSAPPAARPKSSAPLSRATVARAGADATQALVVRLLIAVGAMSLVAGALAIVAIVLILTRGLPRTPTPVVMASAPAPKSSSFGATPPRTGCRLLGRAQQLASPVEASVPAALAPTPDGKSVAVGFAHARNQAGAMTVELGTLRPDLRPTESGQERILGVVPVSVDGHLEFAVDTAQARLASPRTVARELMVGAATKGFARTLAGGKPEELWPLPARARITTPSAASLPGVGYAVAFRSGGQSGKLHFGWLGPDGGRQSELGTLEEPGLVGTPAVSANVDRVLLTYAARASDADHWGIRLATARFGELPTAVRSFDLPAGGPGVEAISPSATGIPGGRWLLQWTEGATGNRQVRAQALGPSLLPDGSAITLSPTELNAGQGAVLDLGGRALVVFMVIADANRELWGASVACSS